MSLNTLPFNPFPPSSDQKGSGGGGSYVLPAATDETLGGIKVGDNLTVEEDGTLNAADPYTLPIAADDTLGGIKVGDNLTVEEDGTLNAPDPYDGIIYSTTPVVIGKWTNNDNIKMRVYSFGQTLEVSNSSWTSTGLTLENAKLLKCFGVNSGKTCYPLMGSIDENNVIKLSVGRTTSGAAIDDLIIEYVESEV